MLLKPKDNGIMSLYSKNKSTLEEAIEMNSISISGASEDFRDYYIFFEDDNHNFCGFTEEEAAKKILFTGGSGSGKTNAFYQAFDGINRVRGELLRIQADFPVFETETIWNRQLY